MFKFFRRKKIKDVDIDVEGLLQKIPDWRRNLSNMLDEVEEISKEKNENRNRGVESDR